MDKKRYEGKLTILSIWLCEITSFSLKRIVSEITSLGKMWHIVILGPVNEVLQWQLTFSVKVPCNILSQVLLLTGSCGSMLPQRARVIWLLLFHTDIIWIFLHTPCLQSIQKSQENMSLCLKKTQKSLAKGNFILCIFYLYQKFIVFVSVWNVSTKAMYYGTTWKIPIFPHT